MSDEGTERARRSRIAARTLPLLDLTSLGDDDTPADIDALAEAAVTAAGNVAALCVWPQFVAQAADLVTGTGIRVASVANFPGGDADPDRAAADAAAILAAGGDEVDVVLPWRRLVDGDEASGHAVVAATRKACGDRTMKVILETGELADAALITRAGEIALDEGADFVKTSTGKTPTSATLPAARLLLDVIKRYESSTGLKVSGGVRTTEQAGEYLAIADEVMGIDWVGADTFRFGASSLLEDLLAVLEEQSGGG